MGISRVVAAVAVCVLAVGCAPAQSGSSGQPTSDEQTGELTVWLFDEPTRAPKEAAVLEAKREFESAHTGVTVTVEYIPVEGRADRFNGAFNDDASAPDVAEFG